MFSGNSVTEARRHGHTLSVLRFAPSESLTDFTSTRQVLMLQQKVAV